MIKILSPEPVDLDTAIGLVRVVQRTLVAWKEGHLGKADDTTHEKLKLMALLSEEQAAIARALAKEALRKRE